jgi:RNA polymerase sigma-70 factor (ECF subfamily)
MGGPADEAGFLIQAKSPEERKRLLADLFLGHRDRLEAMVRVRLPPRLRARLSTSDVLQESYLDAQKRVDEYLQAGPMPFYLWLRRVTAQKLIDLERRHLGRQKRAAGKEVSIEQLAIPGATSEGIARSLVEPRASPSEEAVHAELKAALEAAFDRMDPADREVIALRHFERLTAPETAEVLGIKEEAAQKRYVRALKKMRAIMAAFPGIWPELES